MSDKTNLCVIYIHIDKKTIEEWLQNDEEQYNLYCQNICRSCGSKLQETNISIDEYAKIVGYDFNDFIWNREIKNEDAEQQINRQILNDYIIPYGQLDNALECYQDNMMITYGYGLRDIPSTQTPPIQPNTPKCPTCGSTRIRHISSFEKATNAVAFGLLGNKRKCQFECSNPQCKYRW